jgi:monoamine oxidase
MGEAAAEEQAPIDPWYEGYTPFVEGGELEETYAPEAGWESDLEAEGPFPNALVDGRTNIIEPEVLEEGLAVEEGLSSQGPGSRPLSLPQDCLKKLKSMKPPPSVAVVGGGLAGLMAARELGQLGIKVTVFEAYKEVGGRVRSNRTFSQGRITEEGAELIGSFHTKWLGLARKYGLAVVSRMDPDLYQRAGLDVKLKLDKKLSMDEFKQLSEAMETRILKPIALLAKLIRDPSRPWRQDVLKKFDGVSVQDALPKFCRIAKRKPGNKDERLWKMIEFKLVNDEVAPLDEMNFLGLLCKVRGGQGERFGAGLPPILMGYWDELEIFRCADGCQQLATEMATEIETKPGCRVELSTMVTVIDIKKDEVELTWVPVRNGKPALGSGQTETFAFVILAIPPSVWGGVDIKPKHPMDKDKLGLMSMAPAVKFFSDVKERFWFKEKPPAAPYGGSLTLGQVWEGTDNQTRIELEIPGPQGRPQKVKQGIVLSVFAGPILPGRRVPTQEQFKDRLKDLYQKYDPTPVTGNVQNTLFANWPIEPFIETGYVSPTKDQIFEIGKKLSESFLDRLFFAGEHTQMDFFGYMEGALRSGERAANALMLQACKMPAPASSKPQVITASAAPIRARTASEYEADIPSKVYSSTGFPEVAESLFAGESEEEWEPRAAALASEGPFLDTIEALEVPPGSAIVPEVYEEEFDELEAGGFHEEEYETDSEEHQVLDAYEEEQGTVVEPEFEELYSESDYFASEELVDGEVSDNLAADAFVADNDAKGYFVAFPRLGGLEVKKATVLTPSTFENLMDLMLASNRKNFVIDAHGEPKGLFMPLASGTRIPATKHSLFILNGIEHVRALIRIAKESEDFWGRASGTHLDRWQRIVEVLHSRTWQKMVGSGWPTETPLVSSVDAARSIVQSRINALVDSLFPGNVQNKQGRVNRLIEKMLRLRARGIREIQFRACNIGKDPSSLSEFRRFFGADHLCAPDVRSGMGLSPAPTINRRAVDLLGRDPRTQLFTMPGGRFAIRIIISGLSFSVHCAADTRAAVGEWVAGHVMADSTYRGGPLPIHFLQTQPLVFPLDSDYAAHIRCRSSFWERAVRGSELEGEEFLDDESVPLHEGEADLESPENFEELYGHVHELDQAEALAELEETGGLEFGEEELFEYDVPALGSATSDHPLREIADGQRGRLPDDILAAILTTGESDANDLTNRVLWRSHRDLSGKTLDPKDPKQKALRDESGRILRRQVKPIIWLRQVIGQLDRHRGDIPREFLLGWMAAESDGKVSTVSTLGERGYFQIMWQSGEAKQQLGLTENTFRRLSTDREFSIEQGIRLAKTYRQHFLRKYRTVPDGSELLWRLTKGRHALPTALDKELDRLVKAGTTITWQAVSQSLPKMARHVNLTFDFAAKLKPLADLVPAPPATTPEFYAEASPWIPESEYEDLVSEEDLAELEETWGSDTPAEVWVEGDTSGPRADVRALQVSLNKWRVEKGQAPIKEDGLLSVETNRAVLEFQRDTGFKRTDGLAGPATRERLALLLAILKNIPTSSMLTLDRHRLLEFVDSPGFRSLEGPTQTEVLKRILSYQRGPGALDQIGHLTNLVTRFGFDLLPISSQKLMLRALAARPDDARLAGNFSRLAGSFGFRSLEGPTQTRVFKQLVRYTGNPVRSNNLMNLLDSWGFDSLSNPSKEWMISGLFARPDNAQLVQNFTGLAGRGDFKQLDQGRQEDVLSALSPRFENVQLSSAGIGNVMSLVTASGFEKLLREVRDLMLDVLSERPDNAPLANALRNLAESPRFRHDHRMARQAILQVADSVP